MKKFLILTNGRSGSNFVVDILNQHPEVVNYGEVIGSWSKKRVIKRLLQIDSEASWLDFIYKSVSFFYIDTLFRLVKERDIRRLKLRSKVKCIGVKEFAIHFERYALAAWLEKNDDIKVINLYRENQLERLISLVAMKETGTVYKRNENRNSDKIHLDCSNVLSTLDTYCKELHFQLDLASALDNERVINIKYENLKSQEAKSSMAKEVFNFLEIEDVSVEERQKKILKGSLKNKIQNYDELHQTLADTHYEKYLY